MPPKIFYGCWITLPSFFIGLYVAGAVVFGFTAFFYPLIKEFGWSYYRFVWSSYIGFLSVAVWVILRMGSPSGLLRG